MNSRGGMFSVPGMSSSGFSGGSSHSTSRDASLVMSQSNASISVQEPADNLVISGHNNKVELNT